MNLSCSQPLQHITEHAFGSGGRRRFLLHSDSDGRTWVTVAESMRLFPRRHQRRRPGRVSPEPGCVSVVTVSFADGCDAHTFEDGVGGAPVYALDCHIESRVFADTKHLSESSDIVPPLVEPASTVPDVTMGRDSLHADIPALVSEPDCFPPTLPDCKSEPSDDELPLAAVSPFSSVKLECDPELALPRPHSDSVNPVPGLLPGFFPFVCRNRRFGMSGCGLTSRLVFATGFARQRPEGLSRDQVNPKGARMKGARNGLFFRHLND